MTSSAVFALKNVSQRFAETVALEDVSLEIHRAQTVALVGPSGGGKSTLLRLLVGLLQPPQGEVHFEGEPLTAARLREVRLKLGYVIQSGGLFPHLSADANVTLVARELGWDPARITERVHSLRETVRLPAEAMQRFPGQLSGGQRQRVALMRALMLEPEVLLLDEPLGALDPMTRYELQDELKALFAEQKRTVVLVTHDLAEAAFLAERAIVLRAGKILQDASVPELVAHPKDSFVEKFFAVQRRSVDGART